MLDRSGETTAITGVVLIAFPHTGDFPQVSLRFESVICRR